jgi:hypothetical protein
MSNETANERNLEKRAAGWMDGIVGNDSQLDLRLNLMYLMLSCICVLYEFVEISKKTRV